jgi:lipid-A-disaccharide synthase
VSVAPTASGEAPLLFVIAGEPSGDAIGARLMAALKARSKGSVRFAGIGGERMAREGLTSLFPMSDISLFGVAEIIPKIPLVLRRIRETVAAIRRQHPTAVISIDAPGFAFRVQERLRPGETVRIHCVAPTVWAYRPGRARAIARFLDHLLVLLPFEPPYFEAVGLPCTFIGHPVIEEGAERGDGQGFRACHGIPSGAQVLAVLPGSRWSEVSRLLPIFGETLGLLSARFPDLRVVVPVVPAVKEAVRHAIRTWKVPVLLVDQDAKYDAFAASDAALAASGTVSLELALAGVPMVIGYRINPITAFWVRLLIRVQSVTLANLILGRKLVPEFLQGRCRATMLAVAVGDLLASAERREAQRRGLKEAMGRLGVEGPPPSERAAATILDVIGAGREAKA